MQMNELYSKYHVYVRLKESCHFSVLLCFIPVIKFTRWVILQPINQQNSKLLKKEAENFLSTSFITLMIFFEIKKMNAMQCKIIDII